MKFPVGARLRHKKGGYYKVTAHARLESDLLLVYVYQAESDGKVWVREQSNMEELGRFVTAESHAAQDLHRQLGDILEELRALRAGLPVSRTGPEIDTTTLPSHATTPYQVTDAVATKPIRP